MRSTIFDETSGEDLADVVPLHLEKPPPANTPRSFVASAQRLPLNAKSTQKEIKRTASREWQNTAWDYFDEIGEVKFAFLLKSSILSRVRLYTGVIVDRDEPPVETSKWAEDLSEEGVDSEMARRLAKECKAAMDELDSGFQGGLPELQRIMSLNFDVTGEMFLVQPERRTYTIASISELISNSAREYRLIQTRDTNSDSGKKLRSDTYVARIWRSHPRWSKEADSTMRGVLDQAEKLVLLDRVIRTTARSALPAGAVFFPDGVTVASSTNEDDGDEETLERAVFDAWTAPITDEAAGTTIAPLITRGPPELGEKIKKLELVRPFDPELAAAADRALERLLSGIDVPKDMVSGLSDVKYANAIVIDDGLYKAHIEPMALAECDALTAVYLRLKLRKAGIPDDLVERTVVWYDPSEVVTRPDRSQAANEGYTMFLLSGDAWRTARGFSEADAPTVEEKLERLAFSGVLPPETIMSLLEHYVPEIFQAMQQQGRERANVPSEVSNLLEGQPVTAVPTAPTPVGQAERPTAPVERPAPGAPTPGGQLPPRPAR